MSKIEIDTTEIVKRIENYISYRDINNGKGERTLPIPNSCDQKSREKGIHYMAVELARKIMQSDKEYYESDDFRSRA